jgi:hypothetical protein
MAYMFALRTSTLQPNDAVNTSSSFRHCYRPRSEGYNTAEEPITATNKQPSKATTMRLLTHNSLRNNTADAKGRGFPLQITCGSVRIGDGSTTSMDADQQMAFVKKMLPNLDWPALVQVCTNKLSGGGRRETILSQSRLSLRTVDLTFLFLFREPRQWALQRFHPFYRTSSLPTRSFLRRCTIS